MEANVQALKNLSPDAPVLVRYGEIAQILNGIKATTMDGVDWVRNICLALKVPPLSEFGLKESDFSAVVAKSQKSSSMKGNPIPLTDNELMTILKKSH
jgi:alcohol dehydrogenase class IV